MAALGFRMLVVWYQNITLSGGTSASGPLFAGLLALLNDVRLNAGKPPLGFANPFLYKAASVYAGAYNPVTFGDNRCGELGKFGQQSCCQYGFDAAPLWNPLTGLGTPNYSVLKQAAMELLNSSETV